MGNHPFKGKICVTDRDNELFEYLFLNKVATVDQIRRDVMTNISLQNVNRRLRKLMKRKNLSYKLVEYPVPKRAYSITPKTFLEFQDIRSPYKRRELTSYSPLHDLVLVDIRKRMMASPSVSEYSTINYINAVEEESIFPLKCMKQVQSDACFVANIRDNKFIGCIEYEASVKDNKRYVRLMMNYYYSPEIKFAIYICKTEQIKKRIKASEKKIYNGEHTKIFYALLEDVLDENKPLQFECSNGHILGIK